MMDDTVIDVLAEEAWDLRCKLTIEARERPPGTATMAWSKREPFLRDIDRAVVRLVAAKAAAAERAQLKDEITRVMDGFFAVHGNSTAAFLRAARDLAEGIRQVLDREPLP